MRYIRPYYSNGSEKHARRDAFIGLIRGITVSFREIPLVLLILKLCGTIAIDWIWIAAIFLTYHIVEYIFDLVNIAIEEKDEKERRKKQYDCICERSEEDTD